MVVAKIIFRYGGSLQSTAILQIDPKSNHDLGKAGGKKCQGGLRSRLVLLGISSKPENTANSRAVKVVERHLACTQHSRRGVNAPFDVPYRLTS